MSRKVGTPRHAAHASLTRAFTFPARGIYNVGMAWTIYFKDSATFEVRDGGLDFDYTTGEILGDCARYADLKHLHDLVAKLREFGEAFNGELIPDSIEAADKRHLKTVMVRGYQRLCDDLTALGGAVPQPDGPRAEAMAMVRSVRSHFVHPDNAAAFDAHATERATAHRNSACDHVMAALVEMRRPTTVLGRCGRRSRLPNDNRPLADGGCPMTTNAAGRGT